MMDESGIYEKLSELFVADIMEKLIPGAIHNLANPIGGVTGRVQLMQARIARSFVKLESLHPELYREFALEKIVRDVDILSEESETLLAIFRYFEGKILAFSSRGEEMINLPQMIEAEIKFADFYLDFKHGVNKTLNFKDNVPVVRGARAGYSVCLFALINAARQRMQDTPEKNLAVSVDYDDNLISIAFQDSGETITGVCRKVAEDVDGPHDLQGLPVSEQSLSYALILLNRYGFQTEVSTADGQNIILLRKPYNVT
jgi:signal transduction histidine kinase